MDDEVELFQACEWRERCGDFGFRIFAGSLKGSDVAIAETGPVRAIEFSRLAMKIHEAERLQDRSAAFESLTKIAEVAVGDVDVGGLRDNAFERPQITVHIAEDQNFHRTFPVCAGPILIKRR